MKNSGALLIASRLIFPRTGKKSNARKSLIGAFFCISLSLVPLVMVLTVYTGMIEGITERMIGLSNSHICAIVHPDVEEAATAETLRGLANRLSEVEGVTQVFPEIQAVGLAAAKKGRTGAQIRGVEQDIFSKNKAFSSLFKIVEAQSGIEEVSQIQLINGQNAVIGKKLAETLDIHPGDTVRLITTKQVKGAGNETKTIPKITPFKITAIVSSGYQELDAIWFFVPLETAYSILPLSACQVMVQIETNNPFTYELDMTVERLERTVPNFTRVYKWSELHASQYENFSSTKIMLLFIMLLIVLVASVNISSALVMLVMERRKEIAILKSFGASPALITTSFLLTGLVTGALGVAAGLPAGLLCAVNFEKLISWMEYLITAITKFGFLLSGMSPETVQQFHLLDPAFYLQDIPLSIPLGQLIVISCGTLILSLLVSAIPAIKAGQEKPIETLRKI